jgi:hypothetical protein
VARACPVPEEHTHRQRGKADINHRNGGGQPVRPRPDHHGVISIGVAHAAPFTNTRAAAVALWHREGTKNAKVYESFHRNDVKSAKVININRILRVLRSFAVHKRR